MYVEEGKAEVDGREDTEVRRKGGRREKGTTVYRETGEREREREGNEGV